MLISAFGYDSYGHLTTDSNLQDTNTFEFTGRELDSETGLLFFRARYYNPDLGRFQSEDPIKFGGNDFNLNRYVTNSPANGLDPTGHALTDYGTTIEEYTKDYFSDKQFITVLYSGGGNPEALEAAQLYAQTNGYRIVCLTPTLGSELQLALAASEEEMFSMVSSDIAAQAVRAIIFVPESSGGIVPAASFCARYEVSVLLRLGIPYTIETVAGV